MRTPWAWTIAALVAMAMGQSAVAQNTPASVVPGNLNFDMKVVATGLSGPWELTWGPDDFLWVTERTAGTIQRIDPNDSSKHPAIRIEEAFAPGGQDGLLGMALHPELLTGTGNDFVYVGYTYVDRERGADPNVTDEASPYRYLYTKIVRLTFDEASGSLGEPMELIAGLPASADHNSGRIKIGPDQKLYYTIGDGGNDQLGNWCIAIEAQTLPSADELAEHNHFAYQGKSLRLNLDGTIPDDNPVINGVRSHIFTYGHRNMQGIDFAPDGTLYASEQGPKTDDEVNILLPGQNYGWPHVAGFRDDKAYQYARWKDATTPCKTLSFSDIKIHPSVPREDETAWPGTSEDPLATLFTVPSDWNFTDPLCNGMDFICWPTVAASSIETYFPPSGGIAAWTNSLLVTTLKRGSLYRIPLADDGRSVSGPIERYFQLEDRFRDTALSPDMKTIYVATDPGGITEALAGGTTFTMQHPGAILAFTYRGDGAAAPAEDAAAPHDSPATPQVDAGAVAPTFTAAQAQRGRIAYDANCVSCHGGDLISAHYGPPLAGSYFERKWHGQTVRSLYAYIRDRMPPSRPAALSAETYADITALVLQANGMPTGTLELPTEPGQLDAMTILVNPKP